MAIWFSRFSLKIGTLGPGKWWRVFVLEATPQGQGALASLTYRDLGFNSCQLLLGSCEVRGGFAQCLALGFHVTEHLVEPHNVYDPRAQACSRVGLGGHKLWIELGVLQIWPDGFEAVLVNALFVKVDQGVQETIHFGHGDLSGLPAPVLGHLSPRRHERHHGSTNFADSQGWRTKGLQLCQVGLRKDEEAVRGK